MLWPLPGSFRSEASLAFCSSILISSSDSSPIPPMDCPPFSPESTLLPPWKRGFDFLAEGESGRDVAAFTWWFDLAARWEGPGRVALMRDEGQICVFRRFPAPGRAWGRRGEPGSGARGWGGFFWLLDVRSRPVFSRRLVRVRGGAEHGRH